MNDSDFFLTDPKTGAQVYNPYNYWNIWSTSGSTTHLIQPNKTLGAEIDIAAQATVIRQRNGKVVTDRNQLILCSKYGNPGKNSDPTVSTIIPYGHFLQPAKCTLDRRHHQPNQSKRTIHLRRRSRRPLHQQRRLEQLHVRPSRHRRPRR